jgi:hypothetical protein
MSWEDVRDDFYDFMALSCRRVRDGVAEKNDEDASAQQRGVRAENVTSATDSNPDNVVQRRRRKNRRRRPRSPESAERFESRRRRDDRPRRAISMSLTSAA